MPICNPRWLHQAWVNLGSSAFNWQMQISMWEWERGEKRGLGSRKGHGHTFCELSSYLSSRERNTFIYLPINTAHPWNRGQSILQLQRQMPQTSQCSHTPSFPVPTNCKIQIKNPSNKSSRSMISPSQLILEMERHLDRSILIGLSNWIEFSMLLNLWPQTAVK